MPSSSRPPSPFVPPAVIQAKVLVGIMNAVGLSHDQRAHLLASERLSAAGIDGVAATLPLLSYTRLFDRLARTLQRPTLGLDVSGAMGPEWLGAIGYVFLCSPTLQVAITAFSESVFSIQEASRLHFEITGTPTLVYRITDERIQPRRHDVEFSLGYVHHLIRLYLGSGYAPVEVYFEHVRTGDLSHYEKFFGCPVYFEQDRNALVLEREDLGKSSDKADPHLMAILRHYIQLLDRRDDASSTLTETINQAIADLIGSQTVSLGLVAARLGKSADSLRSLLRQEGTSFRKILRKKRADIARRLLLETNASILEIAQRVGYAETASFTRSFVLETGLQPTRLRRMSQRNAVSAPDGQHPLA